MELLRTIWRLRSAVCCALTALISLPTAAAERDFASGALPLLKQFCLECHEGGQAEANIDLTKMVSDPSLESTFKNWQKVADMLQQRKMPPKEMPQPTDAQRQELTALIQRELRQAMDKHAGDPGSVVVRRLTSAEYTHTIQDLTGQALDLEPDFAGDGVGGEGFTNVGNAQFVQDSTLERYLESAKRVAAHAVIGAGRLTFYRDPGKTGLELSAMHRIQEIYWKYGFRTAAGEGGVPYGLDRYPKAFYAAWRYQHGQALGDDGMTLAAAAAEEGLHPRFVEHVRSIITAPSLAFPTSEITSRWQQLPKPVRPDPQLEKEARESCEEIYRLLSEWQMRLAAAVGDEEEAAVLSEESLNVAKTHVFTARILWPPETTDIRVQFSVISGLPDQATSPIVIWRNPRIRMRKLTGRREDPQPLKEFLPMESARAFEFGKHPASGNGHGHGRIDSNDFVTKGAQSRYFDLTVPEGVRGIEILVEAQLDLEHGEDGVVRCEVSGGDKVMPLKAASASLLADPEGSAFRSWKSGVLEFARLFPQVSHREPAPSDRDPIPAPFVNTYNMPERNFFHTKVKYHRDDRFLVEMMLDDAARRELDEAWTDLLGSFEYHEILLRFVAAKYQLDLSDRSIATLDDKWLDQIPTEQREYIRRLRDEYRAIQQRLTAAEPRHVADLLGLAGRAWRRPLTTTERDRLVAFYENLKRDSGLSHADAIRSTLVRILMSPAFLYRAERSSDEAVETALTDWELASRLSYFLWSSLPDEELVQAAAAGKLRDSDELSRQAQRMLRDPKARRLATEFFGQWFGFYQFDRWRGVDAERFPEFTDVLKSAMYEEAISFFEHIIRQDRPVNEILFADYSFLNQDLAAHYGIDADVSSTAASRVQGVNRFHRGGLLGLGAILTVTSAPLRTSPVKRGDWVLRRVLGTAVPPPPADAGSIPADDVLPSGPRTVRQRLEAHRREATCNNCHSRIDPFGFALEHYDSIGRWRERYRDGAEIDPSGTLRDGTQVTGVDGLRRYLQDQQTQFQRMFSTKLIGYALGRSESIGDQRLIEEMMSAAEKGDDRFSQYVVKIVTSHQFRYHRGQ